MEEIKTSLKHDYNLAVNGYNGKDYITFFRNIRPSIELLSKLMMYDIMRNDNVTNDLIEGEKTITKGRDNVYSLSPTKAYYKPTGKEFPLLVQKVYYYKHPEIFNRNDESKKRLRIDIDAYISNLVQYYNMASALGNHTGKIALNTGQQALTCAAFFAGYFDFLNSNRILQPTSLEILNQLEEFNFSQEPQNELKSASLIIEEKNATISERDAALLIAQQQQTEVEHKLLEAQDYSMEIKAQLEKNNKELAELREKIANLNDVDGLVEDEETNITQPEIIYQNNPILAVHPKLIDILRGSMSDWDVQEESMDDDQLDLIEMTIDKSMLVSGCAGSGKSVIAMHKAQHIADKGYDVILITLTKSLSSFMCTGKNNSSYRFYHYDLWKYYERPTADYIIVDEIQDFTKEDIAGFIQSARKNYFFFGDSAQSIYKQFGKQTLTIEEISLMTGLVPLQLYNNYRLPRSVAKITQGYIGVDVNPYEEKVYQNKEKALPYFIHFDNLKTQVALINSIIENNHGKSIGVLLPSNELVLKVCNELQKGDNDFEFKYKKYPQDKKSYGELRFNNTLPKVMTYHSAKGLQFDIVILPMYEGANKTESRKSLYVAMTRTMHQLYIMYSTPDLKYPLSEVPTRFYQKG